jgi:hypothetical protein
MRFIILSKARRRQEAQMADLLECLLQVSALRTTPDRAREIVARVAPHAWHRPDVDGIPPVMRLAALSRRAVADTAWLRSALTAVPVEAVEAVPPEPVTLSPAALLERFCAAREDALRLLERCTAEDLSRRAPAGSRSMSVADRVADMLAGDIDTVGRLRLAMSRHE